MKTTLEARDWLREHRFIKWDEENKVWVPRSLGTACTAASMDPDDALSLNEVISMARCLSGAF